ncbi:hypothetical protein JXA88_18120 [Candidatus Fermentibacteria bacterium]|nr:hypothetical protein [Candidatus Fermentibacteria bacterium]
MTDHGGSSAATLLGTYIHDGISYSADLTEQGSYSFDISGSGAEFEHQQSTQGSVTAPGFSMMVSESYWYKSIYVTQYVENMERIVDNSWTADGISYRLSNARIRTSFVDSRPTEFDSYWIAQGSLLKGNAVHGQIGMGVEGLQLRIWLDTPAERIQLEAWNL